MDEFKIVSDGDLPEIIKKKLNIVFDEVMGILNSAEDIQQTKLRSKFILHFEHSAPSDILTDEERYQQVSFITKYDNLPALEGILIKKEGDRFYLKNYDYIRHILNEYRPLIANQNDSIYFTKIHSFCHLKLINRDPSVGLSITVKDENDRDITEMFTRIIGERIKAIKMIIQNCEFDYIYNGILQHSDTQYSERYWDEYYTGKINYVFIKHALMLSYIKDLFIGHYRIINSITFPKLGPL